MRPKGAQSRGQAHNHEGHEEHENSRDFEKSELSKNRRPNKMAEVVPMTDNQIASGEKLGEMLKNLSRTKNAIKVFRESVRLIQETVKPNSDALGTDGLWGGLIFKIDTLSKYLSRKWTEGGRDGKTDPSDTEIFGLYKAVAWFLKSLVENQAYYNAAEIRTLMDSREAWPLKVIFEKGVSELYLGRSTVTGADGRRAAVCVFNAEHSAERASVEVPGLAIPFAWKSASHVAGSYLPFGAILKRVRAAIEAPDSGVDIITGPMVVGTIVYCFYEIVLSLYDYGEAYVQYSRLQATGEKIDDRFAYLKVPNQELGKNASGNFRTWYEVLFTAHADVYGYVQNYYSSACEGSSDVADIFSGIDPTTLANDPNAVQNLIRKTLGFDVSPDMLKSMLGNIPSLRSLVGGQTA